MIVNMRNPLTCDFQLLLPAFAFGLRVEIVAKKAFQSIGPAYFASTCHSPRQVASNIAAKNVS
jgi:hypothetical protein